MQPLIARDAQELDDWFAGFLSRYAFVSTLNIERFAERFAQRLKLTGIPREALPVVERLGIRVERASLERPTRAIWVRSNQHYTIVCSRHDSPASVNFSIWHEVFEMMASHARFPSLLSQAVEQRLANRFATSVLMPRRWVLEEAASLKHNPECLAPVLARRFGVSQSAIRKRLYELQLLRPARA